MTQTNGDTCLKPSTGKQVTGVRIMIEPSLLHTQTRGGTNDITAWVWNTVCLPVTTSTKEFMFSPASVYWLVCRQDCEKMTERIVTKLEWRTGLGPEWTPITLDEDPCKGTDPRSVLTFARWRVFFDTIVNQANI